MRVRQTPGQASARAFGTKASRWLWCSLGLNLALAIVLVREVQRLHSPAQLQLVSKELTNRHARLPQSNSILNPAPQPAVVQVNEVFHWSQLESADYRVYVANLRAIGCPETTLRDIIVADVTDLFHHRVKELVDTVQDRFWDLLVAKGEMEKMVDEKHSQLNALEGERDAMLKELLGYSDARRKSSDEISQIEALEGRKQFLDFLPAEKLQQCLEVDQRFDRLRRELAASDPPLAQQDYQARLKDLQNQQERNIQLLLDPQEWDEYKLRASQSAQLRFRLNGFDASEQELRDIARIQENLAGTANSKESNANFRVAQRTEVAQRQREAVKNLLGEERFAAYERTLDNRFQEFLTVSDRLELPPQSSADAFDIRKAAESQAQRVRTNNSMAADQRAVLLAVIRQETEHALAGALGAEAYAVYQGRSGQWLGELDAKKLEH